jgi:hypothetical protein
MSGSIPSGLTIIVAASGTPAELVHCSAGNAVQVADWGMEPLSGEMEPLLYF